MEYDDCCDWLLFYIWLVRFIFKKCCEDLLFYIYIYFVLDSEEQTRLVLRKREGGARNEMFQVKRDLILGVLQVFLC